MATTITVSVRIRPPRDPSSAISIDTSSSSSGLLSIGPKNYSASEVVQGSDQKVAYDAIALPLLKKLRSGYSCTLLAYGQTGSGKTHTVFGPAGCLTVASVAQAEGGVPREWGIFPRLVLDILKSVDIAATVLHASAVEIYQDSVYDLLADRSQLRVGSKRPGLKVGKGKVSVIGNDAVSNHCGTHPPGCSCHKCFKVLTEMKAVKMAKRAQTVGQESHKSNERHPSTFATVGETLRKLETADDVARFALLVEGTRTATGHALNARSSRSHCLINLHVSQRSRNGKVSQRKLLFVDLAGSERIAKTGVVGVARHQATSINGSLTVLGKVIRALSLSQKHVPYRDSTLTMLLRKSLDEPMASTSVVINVAPDAEHAEETVCSLEFGKRLKKVPPSSRNRAAKASCRDGAEIDIETQVDSLRGQLAIAKDNLAHAEARGQGEHFDPTAPPGEIRLFKQNVKRFHEEEAKARHARAELAELRAMASGTNEANRDQRIAAAEDRVQARDREVENYKMIVLRQQSIRGFYRPPKEGYLACEREIRQLEAQLDMFLAQLLP